MSKISLLTVFTAVLLAPTFLTAQATRTWVSGVGDDANPCSRTAPCKTFAGAISKTAAGGEINALDPAGYGAVTITKAITIDGGGGQVASVLVSGTNGIVVQAGANDVVILRNLRFNGLGTGINGVRWLSGKALHLEHDTIFGFTTNGVDIAKSDGGQAFIDDVYSTHNGHCGINNASTITNVNVSINNSHFNLNGFGGICAADNSRFTARDSEASGNAFGFIAQPSAGTSELDLTNSVAGNNTNTGIYSGGLGGTATVRITGVSMFNNPTNGMHTDVNGTIISFSNNYNGNGGAPNSNTPPQ